MKNSSLLTRHSALSLKAFAKINWFLKVCGLREDGYHEIISLMQKISLHDVLHFKSSGEITIISDIDIPKNRNIVFKTASLLKEKFKIDTGAEIRLIKNIPVAAGLGGGSSDAAETLRGLNELWSLGLTNSDFHKMAENIGSDVPFFLNGPLALVTGRGEQISACKSTRPSTILLVKPYVSVSTRWAYNELSVMRNALRDTAAAQNNSSRSLELTKRIDKSDNIKFLIQKIGQAELGKNINIQNDLENVTAKKFPVISKIKDSLLKEGAILSLMSGSGSTVFGVFDTINDAKNASRRFKDCWTFAVQTLID